MSRIILVADGDASIRMLLKELLEARGYQVETVGDLAGVQSVMERSDLDVVFAELTLDGNRGQDLMVLAKQHNVHDSLILLADASMDDLARSVMALEAMAYLTKPIDRVRLEMLAHLAVRSRDRARKVAMLVDEKSQADSFLSALAAAGDDAIFLLDGEKRILDGNEAAAGLVQVGREELVGRLYLSLFSEQQAGLQEELIQQARESRETQRIEEYRGGAVFDTVVRPVLEGRQVNGFVVVTRDITDSRRSEVWLAESEKRYRSVYEAARDAIIMFDRNTGAILDCNAAARRFYGYSSEEMAHMTLADLAEEPERAMEALRSGMERVPLTYHLRRGGASFPVEISMSHFVHDGRKVSTAYIQDNSHRKVVEEALREGAKLYRAVVEDQTELICRYTPDGHLTFVNRAFATFFGVDEDEILGSMYFPQLAEGERRDLKSWLSTTSPARPVFDREQKVKRHDGEPRQVLWTNRAIFDKQGKVSEVQAVGRDVTEQKEMEHALFLAQAEMEQYRLGLEATFRSIPDAIITVDDELTIIATNSAADTLLGLGKGQGRGDNLREVMQSDGNPCLSVLKQVLKTGKQVRGYETELEVPNLGIRMVEFNCSPLVDYDAHNTGAVLVVRDVSRIADLEKRLHERHGFRGIIGRSQAMQEIYRLLEQLSQLESIVLILGESGTGKELVADALHYGGPRAGKPLVKVNCSALSESLLESELFGHVRGAFTGAVRDKVGRIQSAQGGTLFLDEIGDISHLIQLKLLRFLEQKEYERVGESKTMTADVRIIAATNVDLLDAVQRGVFREDLYYRLNVMPVSLPSLRERQADIPLLVEHFLELFSDQFNKSFSRVSEEVMDLFMRYSWPGNIRELRHILEHACILSSGGEIALRHMRPDLVGQMRGEGPALPSQSQPWAEVQASATSSRRPEREDIIAVLERCGGNKARAARQLGIHRATLYRKLKAWGLD